AHKITIQNVLLKIYDGDILFILTAVINAMILLPFIFLFSPSSFINDKFAKTKVIRICAILGLVISVAVLFSYLAGAFNLAFALTLILAAQSAIYSPAKYGIIKALVGPERLGTANGVIQALTIVAILASSFLFSFIFEKLYVHGGNASDIIQSVYPIGIFLVVFSALEAYFAYKLPYISETNEENEKFELKKYISLSYLRENLKEVRSDKNIWLSIAGLSIFWGISQIIIAAFPA
ncbi:MFS transporter, partial [Campylobacter concisus]